MYGMLLSSASEENWNDGLCLKIRVPFLELAWLPFSSTLAAWKVLEASFSIHR